MNKSWISTQYQRNINAISFTHLEGVELRMLRLGPGLVFDPTLHMGLASNCFDMLRSCVFPIHGWSQNKDIDLRNVTIRSPCCRIITCTYFTVWQFMINTLYYMFTICLITLFYTICASKVLSYPKRCISASESTSTFARSRAAGSAAVMTTAFPPPRHNRQTLHVRYVRIFA